MVKPEKFRFMRSLWLRAALNSSRRETEVARSQTRLGTADRSCCWVAPNSNWRKKEVALRSFAVSATTARAWPETTVWRPERLGAVIPVYYRLAWGEHDADFPDSWRIWSSRHRQDWDQREVRLPFGICARRSRYLGCCCAIDLFRAWK